MTDSVERLAALIAPPESPVFAVGDWGTAETMLRLTLPSEFKELLGRYGVGQFDDITLLTPFETRPERVFDLVEAAESLIPWFDELREDDPERFPFPLYPEPGGLLPWAKTSVGTDLCWLTEGPPDRWPTAVWNIREGGSRYDLGAVDLLYEYFSGNLRIDLLGPSPAVPWFDPHRDLREVWVTVADSDVPYAERARILRDHLAPTADRGQHGGCPGASAGPLQGDRT